MDRRGYLTAVGASGLAVGVGGGLVAYRKGLVGPPRGAGDPVSVERTITDDTVEYLPDSDEVRYATLMSADGPVDHETEPFERWANRRCASVASEAVLPAVEARVDGPVEGVGKGVRSRLTGLVVTVDRVVTRNREGEVTSRPNVPFERLVEVSPDHVGATVALAGREYARNVPVFVTETETQYLDAGL